MICSWCKAEHFSPRSHICSDGSTLEDRARYVAAGMNPPQSLMRRIFDPPDKRSSTDTAFEAKLTEEGIKILDALKIGWKHKK